jgi:endonuclease I/V8-like Glu-specific endopeptidase
MTKEERLRRAAELVKRIAPDNNVENLRRSSGLESMDEMDEKTRLANQALEKLHLNRPLALDESAALEAIVLPRERPVVFVQKDTFKTPEAPWEHYNEDLPRQNIEAAILSIGRVELPNHPSLPYGGTAFVVGDGLLMTNRHVAAIFTTGLGTHNLNFTTGLSAEVDFKREQESTDTDSLHVLKVVMIHPYWDMALLKVEGLAPKRKALKLSTQPPETLDGTQVAVIGYPARDWRNDSEVQDRIFQGVYNIKRMHPGLIRTRKPILSFGKTVSALTHDASTLGGNSGSAVIDVRNHEVVGLHFGGKYLEDNFAVPTYELARDPRVAALGVQFSGIMPTSTGEWDAFWQGLETTGLSQNATTPASPGVTIMQPNTVTTTMSNPTATWTIPLQVSVSFGTPLLTTSLAVATPSMQQTFSNADYAAARAEAAQASSRPYYDAAKDNTARQSYYQGLNPNIGAESFFHALSKVVKKTHHTELGYKPSKHLYPWVDLQPNLKITSIYSGQQFDPLELIAADEQTEIRREEALAAFRTTESAALPGLLEAHMEMLEATMSFNCEHSVPQSWFKKKQPMRGDLHHLFACEITCNSFRGNTPFFDFNPVEEAVMQGCGRSETNKFEPKGGKGIVARATLYFLLRYPGQINNTASEYTPDRIKTLIVWHKKFPVGDFEKHRNQAIFEKQGNRNPLIDFPEWVDKIDLLKGLG